MIFTEFFRGAGFIQKESHFLKKWQKIISKKRIKFIKGENSYSLWIFFFLFGLLKH